MVAFASLILLSNSSTDKFGRSNFVDERGNCVGFKEFPDGTPIRWSISCGCPAQNIGALKFTDESLKEYLDRLDMDFSSVSVNTVDDKTVAEIVLSRDGEADIFLYAVIATADSLYTADLKFTSDDKRVFRVPSMSNVENKIVAIRQDMSRVMRDISALEGIVRSIRAAQRCSGKDEIS